MTDRRVEVEVTGEVSGLRQKLKEAGETISKFGQDGKKSLEGFSAGIGEAQKSLMGFLSIGAMVSFLKGTKDAVTQAEASFRGLEAVANFTGVGIGRAMQEAEKLSADGMMTVAESSKALQNLLSRGYSIDQAVDTLNRLKDAAAFNRQASLQMGEAVVGASEGLKNENSMLVDNAGVTKNVAKMWEEFAKQQGITTNGMTQAQKIQAEYNGIMKETEAQTGNASKAMGGMQGKSAQMNKNFADLKITIGEALMPAFLKLSEWGNWAIKNVFQPLLIAIKVIGASFAAVAVDIGNVWTAVTTFTFKGLGGKLEANAKMFKETVDSIISDTLKAGSSFKPTEDSGRRKAAPDGPADTKKKKGKAEKSRTSEWDFELEQQKLAHERMNAANGTFYEFSKEQEMKYWKEVLATKNVTASERLQIDKKVVGLELALQKESFEQLLASYKAAEEAAGYNLEAKAAYAHEEYRIIAQKYGLESKEAIAAGAKELAIAKDVAEQKKSLIEEQMNGIRAAQTEEITIRERAAQLEFDLGLINAQQLIALKREYTVQTQAIELQAAADRVAALASDPASDPVELARRQEAMLELKRQHKAQLASLDRESVIESMAMWTDLTDRMSSLWDRGMQSLMNGTLTWRNAFKAIGAELVSWFATQVVGNQIKAWISGHAKMLAIKLGFTAQEKVATIAGSTATIATKTAETTVVSANNAVQAGTGAAASQASIPIIGPILALAAMAAVFAAVSSMGKRKSAAGGYDIPRGVNPLVQTHEEEMILPKQYANVIRGLAGKESESSSAGESVHIHARSDSDVIRVGDLKRLLTGMRRDFVSIKS